MQTVVRDIVYCNDVEGLIFFLKLERALDDDAIIKIGIDGGQGSLKVCLTIHSQKDEDEKRLKSPEKRRKSAFNR